MDMDEDAAAPDVGAAPPGPAIVSRDEIGQQIREEMQAGGIVLLNGGVPPDPSKLRRVEIPVGMAVASLIDELRRLPASASFAEAFGDADMVAVFYAE